jgi:type I restriction enzyme M protein
MDLYFIIESILKKNYGKISFDDAYGLLRNHYSKKALNDFLNDNKNDFQFDGNIITSYRIKINVFLEELKSLIYKYRPTSKILKYLIVGQLFDFLDKFDLFKQLTTKYDNIYHSNFPFAFEIGEIVWDDDFKSTPEKLYQFSYRLFEFLIEQEQINYGIFSTPQTLIELFRKLMPDKKELKIYNPAAGFLNLVTGLKVYSNSKLKIKASEINQSSYYLGQVFSAIHDVDVDFACTDSGEEITQLKDSGFDFIVSNLPFAVKDRDSKYRNRKYKDFSMHIIAESLHKLKDSGRAVFLVNDGILFSVQKEAIAFRKEIITSGFLNCVISLPTGIMPHSGVKASLLVFEKGKPKDHVQLINAIEKEFYSLRPDKSVSLDTDKIIPLIAWEKAVSEQNEVHESQAEYGKGKAKLNVSIDKFQENSFELSAGRYVAVNKQLLGEDYITLKDVCQLYKAGKIENKGVYPYIRITELNGQTLSEINSSFSNNTHSSGKLVNQSSILIGTIKGSYKPTWFPGNVTIEVSGNVAVFGFDKRKVFPPYLVQELNATYVTDQFDLLAKGSAINSITREDLLSVKVKIPVIEEQERIYNNRVSFENEHQLIQIQETKTISDAEVFKVFKHEIGNILRGPEGFLEILPDFLSNNNIKLTTSIVEGHPETIGQMVEISLKKLDQIHWLMENLKGILFSDKKYFNPELTELKPFIERCLENEIQNNEMQWYVVIDGEYTGKHKYFAEIDRAQFENVIRNMVVNALNHGKNDNKIQFVVNIMSYEEFDKTDNSIVIDFINDGNPLPAEFTIEEYIQFGKKIGASNGHGLGGYLINQVVDNHNGFIEIIPPGQNIEVEKGNIVSNKVHFEITIPKNQ